MGRDLGERLIAAGLTSRAAVEKVRAHLRPGDELGDRLVNGKAIAEVDLLRFLARELGTRFVTSEKIARLQLSAQALEIVPVHLAESLCVLPLAYDPGRKALSVVMANPRQVHLLDDSPRVARLEHVVAYVGLRSAILAGIRRHYYGDRRAFAAADARTENTRPCPSCRTLVGEEQVECHQCGLLLAVGPFTGTRESSLVRALITEDSTGHHQIPEARETVTTPGFVVPMDDRTVPALLADLDTARRRLSPFEAFVVACVDGQSTVADLVRLSGVAEIELQSVLASLAERGLVELRPGDAAPAPDRAQTEPALPVTEPQPAGADPPPKLLPPTPQPPPRACPQALTVPSSPARGAQISPVIRVPLDPAPRQSPVENVLQRAVLLERRGDVDGAITVLKNAIARNRDPAPLYNRLALVVLNQKHDYAQAEELLRKALELQPGNEVYKKNLMKVLALEAASSAPKKVRPGLLSKLLGRK